MEVPPPDVSSELVVLDVVVPAYNEALRLPDTLVLLRAALAELGVPCRVTVVDNASDDGTSAVVVNAPPGPVPVRLLWCGEPGKGFAVRRGVLASDARYVGFCDADLATAPAALAQVLNLLYDGADAVVGSRAHPESVVEERHSVLRRWGAVAFRGAVRQVVRGVSETQCGFKSSARRRPAGLRALRAVDSRSTSRCWAAPSGRAPAWWRFRSAGWTYPAPASHRSGTAGRASWTSRRSTGGSVAPTSPR
ncbi:LigA protein [Micromonospora sp. M42]|uniref:glycosyltransferase n=1 Tax=Micromonospora sp. M42 TaxID=457406 RepID=UPI0003EEE105|nr:glycosyltransferase [Micromonospora sp. M42]EWM66990.1 LigA protein [Micromonospora sp. M42]